MFLQIVWDSADDPRGNCRHIRDKHKVTVKEVEQVLRNPRNKTVTSRSSGNPIVFGRTRSGKHIAVVYEYISGDIPMIYPITAYPVPKPDRV
jgi:hypothetical protein